MLAAIRETETAPGQRIRDSPFSPQEARLVGAAREPPPVVLHPMPVALLEAARSPLLREAAVSDRAACARSLLLQQFSPGRVRRQRHATDLPSETRCFPGGLASPPLIPGPRRRPRPD